MDNVAPDPSGVRLGDTLEEVKSAHPDYRPPSIRTTARASRPRFVDSIGAEYVFRGRAAA